MQTVDQEHSHSAAYWGEYGHWLIAYAQHRDSDILTRANWASFVEALGGESDTVAIERSNHWAVGWVEYLIVDPSDTERVKLAEDLREKLEDYPILDETAWSNLEWDEYTEAWQDYGKSEFVRALRKKFSLSDVAEELLDQDEELQEFFESLIPSGEYFIAEGSGVSVQTSYAVDRCDRDTLAAYLRKLRAA
jgi:hypothetical protein